MTIIHHETEPGPLPEHVSRYLRAYTRSNAKYTLERLVGHWLIHKARKQASALGTYAAARNLRKQGLPIELALSILRVRQQ
jgi:hypothetical protein